MNYKETRKRIRKILNEPPDDFIGKCRIITAKQCKKIEEFYKQLIPHLAVKFYDYDDITITVIKQKKKEVKKSTSFADYFSSRKYPKFMTKKEMKALAKLHVENACESLGLNKKKIRR